MFIKTIYLLHRPAPGPSPCPLHTQRNSGRNGKKPIRWPLQSRSSSTRLWYESSVYFCFTLWMFIINPKCFAPVWSVHWFLCPPACTRWSAVWLWLSTGWSADGHLVCFRGGRRLRVGLRESERAREGGGRQRPERIIITSAKAASFYKVLSKFVICAHITKSTICQRRISRISV